MADPSQDDDVLNFLAFADALTGSHPEPAIAVRFIKDANGDVDRALNNYEQDPNRYAADKYDEAQFSQDRDGGSNQYAGVPSFQIDHANDSLTQYSRSAAATRPNTPSNSMHDSGMGDSQTLGAGQGNQNRAWGQETGVVGGTGAVQFGPANRDYYDSSRWALTTVVNTVLDPVPSQRKRDPGEPAFMKPLPSQDYLPSLITVLNTIPMAHNALLFKDHLLPEYGQDPLWWTGTPITLAQTIILDDQPQDNPDSDIIHETQRLMAFLDYTERSYGSVEALTKLDNSQWGSEGDTEAVKFLEAWQAAAIRLEPEARLEKLFQTTAHQVTSGTSSNPSFKCLTPVLENGGSGTPVSLYDVLDETLWSNDPDGTKDVHASIDSIAEVLVMIVKQPDVAATGLNMTIPASWYADRYLTKHEPMAKQMRRECAEVKDKIAQIQQSSQKLSRYNHNGKTGDALTMLETAMSAFTIDDGDRQAQVESDGDTRMSSPSDNRARDSATLKQLQKVYDNVKGKIEALKAEEGRAQKALNQLSSLLKEPVDSAEVCPKFEYHLCGISTDPAVTYIKTRSRFNADANVDEAVDLEAVDFEASEAAQPFQQWWRIHYDHTGQISKSRISEADVLTAAAIENREVLLVYASEKALQQPFEDIPQILAEFVSTDTMLFREELAEDAEQPPPYDAGSLEGNDDEGFGTASATEWLNKTRQPEMAEKGAGLVAEMASGNGRGKAVDTDVAMSDAGSAQHIEYAEGTG